MFKVGLRLCLCFLLGLFPPVVWGSGGTTTTLIPHDHHQPRRLDDTTTAPCPDTTETVVAEHAILLDVIGRPGQLSSDEINLAMRLAFQSAYNQVATCSVSGAFRRVEDVQFLPDAVDAFGDAPTTQGAGVATREFTFAVAVQSTCRGCADGFALFANDASRNQEEERQLNKKTATTGSLIRGGLTSSTPSTSLRRQLSDEFVRRMSNKSMRGGRRPIMRMRPQRTTLSPTPAPTICEECDPPSTQDFLDAFNEAFVISSVDRIVYVAELSAVEEACEETTSDFVSTFVLNVTGEPDAVTPEQIQVVEQSIIETYNDINALGRGYTCDPLSRIAVDGVSLSILSGGSGLADEAAATRAGHLEASFSIRVTVPGICRGCDPNAAKLFQRLLGEETEPPAGRRLAPGSSPTTAQGIPIPSSSPAAQSPTGSNSSSSGRHRGRRQLQTILDCKCSEDAERRAPTETEFLTALNETFQVLREEGLLDFISEVEEVLEVEEVSCSADVSTFTTTVPIEFVINVEGITGSDDLALESAFLTSYNNLTQAFFCDPTFRMVVQVGISGLKRQDEQRRHLEGGGAVPSAVPTSTRPPSVSPSVSPSPTMTNQPSTTNPPTNVPTFVAGNGNHFFPNLGFASVEATCRGCEENAKLYDDVDDPRRNLQALLDLGFRRRLEDGASCFCPADIPEDRKRSPSTDEFQVAYNESVVALNLDNVLEVSAVFAEIEPSAAPTFQEPQPTLTPTSPPIFTFQPTPPFPTPAPSPQPSFVPSMPLPLPTAAPTSAPTPQPTEAPTPPFPTTAPSPSPSTSPV